MKRTTSLRIPFFMMMLLAVTAIAAQDPVQVPGTKVQLVPPLGFELSGGFAGFENIITRSTITISELPAPIDSVRQSMTESRFAARGMTLRSSEEVTIDGKPGKLMLASLDQEGVAHGKWLCIFGDAQTTVLAVATYPETTAGQMEPMLRRALLTTRRVEERAGSAFEGMKFRVAESEKLKIANRMSTMMMLTDGGKPGDANAGDPLYVITSTPNEESIDDLAAFSKSRIRDTADVQAISGIEGKEMVIGGLQAYEVTANARAASTGTTLKLYQVIIVRGDKFYVIQGMVGADKAEAFLAEFRKVTDTFRLNI